MPEASKKDYNAEFINIEVKPTPLWFGGAPTELRLLSRCGRKEFAITIDACGVLSAIEVPVSPSGAMTADEYKAIVKKNAAAFKKDQK